MSPSVAGCELLLPFQGIDDGRSSDASPDVGGLISRDVDAAAAADAQVGLAEGDASQPESGAVDETGSPAVDATDSAVVDATDSAVVDATASEAAAGVQGGDAEVGPVHLGCFMDSQTRDLPYQAYDSQLSTTAMCVSACIAKGYRFAATQWGSQCYCGDAYGGQGPAGGCTTPCTGDATQVCGGAFQNSVYVAVGPAPRATYVGCYADGMIRELPDQLFGGAFTTVESCAAGCAYHGYFYAGPENGNQCFCGNSYGAQAPARGCTAPCTGNSAEVCGGSYANSVYRTWVAADAGTDAGDGASD